MLRGYREFTRRGAELPGPKPFEVAVSAGDLLATRFQAYKVLKVVPPGPVDLGTLGRGNLVGWIEIDPRPLPPPPKTPDAADIPPAANDGPPLSPGATPPLPRRPRVAGEVEDGKYPDHVPKFNASESAFGVLAAVRCPVRVNPQTGPRIDPMYEFPTFWLKRSSDGQSVDLSMMLGVGLRFSDPADYGLFPPGGFRYRLSNRDVLPIYDELYLAGVDLDVASIELDRVTDKVPRDCRPATCSSSIPAAGWPVELFDDESRDTKTTMEIKRIDAPRANKSPPLAIVRIRPPVRDERKSVTWGSGNHGFVLDGLFDPGEPFEVTLKAGDLLATHGHAFKILKVVPPGPVDLGKLGRGRMVGWIEIDPKPVPPPAKVPEMAPVSPQALPAAL